MNKKLKVIFIIILTIFIASGIYIALSYILAKDKHYLTFDKNGVAETTLNVENLSLAPGENEEASVYVKSDFKEVSITILFTPTATGSLKDFLKVKIVYDNDQVIEKDMTYLLNGNLIEFKAHEGEIKIIYYMPSEVGNEAQGATTSFDVKITAKNVISYED